MESENFWKLNMPLPGSLEHVRMINTATAGLHATRSTWGTTGRGVW
jgi:hypothetical protein